MGWGISIGLHLLLGVGFLVSAWVHDTSNGTVARPAVKSYLLEPVELLEVEPVINDLRIEPMVGLERADTFEPVPLPEVEPVGIERAADAAIGVVGGSGESGFAVTAVAGSESTFVNRFCGSHSPAMLEGGGIEILSPSAFLADRRV